MVAVLQAGTQSRDRDGAGAPARRASCIACTFSHPRRARESDPQHDDHATSIRNDIDAVRFQKGDRLRTLGAGLHPNVSYSLLDGLSNHLFGYEGLRND